MNFPNNKNQKQVTCPFFLKGTCKFNDNCKNSHIIDLESNQNNIGQGNQQFQNRFMGQGNQGFYQKPHYNKSQMNSNFSNSEGNQHHQSNNGYQGKNQKFSNQLHNQGNNFHQGQGINSNNPHSYHGNNEGNNFHQNQSNQKICMFFTKPGGCNKGDKCSFIHNYHETLHYVTRQESHSSTIVGCCSICK